MKYLVVGHLSFDVFPGSASPDAERFGGIVRAVETLSSLIARNDRVLPVFGVHPDDYERVLAHLSSLPGVETDGIFRQETPTHRVQYYPREGGGTVACAKELSPPIPFSRIKPFLDVHAVLLNMISGADVTLETLDEMRIAIRGEGIPLHFDFHGLTTAINNKHERVRRPLDTWRRWAFMVDSIQMNEEEIAGLTAEDLPEDKTIGHLFTLGIRAAIITRGARGATVYTQEHKHVLRSDIGDPATPAGDELPGRGDMFGAAFLHRFSKAGDATGAAAFAHDYVSGKVNAGGTAV